MTRRNIVGMLVSRFNYNRVTVTIVHISVREWLPASPPWHGIKVRNTLGFQLCTHAVDGMVFIGVHLKQAFHFLRLLVIHFNQYLAINPDIPVRLSFSAGLEHPAIP